MTTGKTMKKFKPKVMLTKRGSFLIVAENIDQYIFMKLFNCYDLGEL